MRITPRQITFILLDSFQCIRVYITIYLLICLIMFHAVRKRASYVFILGSLVKKGDDLIFFPSSVYLLSSPSRTNSTTAVATSEDSASSAASAARPKPAFLSVGQRDKDIFLPIIRGHILPEKRVMSEIWKTHDCLNTRATVISQLTTA